ncbi:hypothetical protein LCGC14_0416950 [marine sediment metagenome]|uniref:Uncharacterized protein n=1 Tax=marine sediment metagenome TaxID=412755 RepID=A0A0F9VE59_9ZZZZ
MDKRKLVLTVKEAKNIEVGGRLAIKRLLDLGRISEEEFEAISLATVKKAEPLIRQDEAVKWIKALMRGGIMVSKPEQLIGAGERIRKDTLSEVMEIVREYQLDGCLARDDYLVRRAKGWLKLDALKATEGKEG